MTWIFERYLSVFSKRKSNHNDSKQRKQLSLAFVKNKIFCDIKTMQYYVNCVWLSFIKYNENYNITSISIYIRMKHFTDESHCRWLIWILFCESWNKRWMSQKCLKWLYSHIILLIVNLNVPSSNGVSAGPKITAFHCIILLSQGAPLTPAGGSSWNSKKVWIFVKSKSHTIKENNNNRWNTRFNLTQKIQTF